MSDASQPPITLQEMRQLLFTAVVCDALDTLGLRNQSPRVPLTPLTSQELLVGRCKTTLWADMFHPDPQPYELELQAVDACQPDHVLIAAAGGSMRSGIWGELLTTAARNRGCIGAVVDGAVRDVAKIRALGFSLFARGTCNYDSLHRQRVIDVDVPVDIGGVTVHPQDLILADGDGIVVVPQDVEREVIAKACHKVGAENQVRTAIEGGMSAQAAYRKYGVL